MTNKDTVFTIGILLILFVAACAPKIQETVESLPPAVTETMAEERAPIETAASLPANPATEAPATGVDGEALIMEKLQNHHSISRVFNANHTREEWNVTLDRMIGYGAKIPEEEKQVIIDYLLNR
jgi:hypothetical protein